MTKPSVEAAKLITIPENAKPYMDWLGDEQMTCRQMAILMIIEANPGCGVGAIANVLDIPKPSVTRAADKLAEWELIHRMTDYTDRRLVQLFPGRKPKKGGR